ncbi:MBL fold metallo-hydrolase [Candidatus Peregrinibacteria bacterium]|nr:MBL fold metallo-hydrolase [Candidatus Peregrinibacteria bacterium]
MDIQWHGENCVSFKGKTGTLLVNPNESKASADIVLANSFSRDRGTVGNFGKDAKVFDLPGEYEAKNIFIQGITAYDRPREKDSAKKDEAERIIIFAFEMDGFKICHLGNLGHKLTPEMLEAIGDVDILLVPVGGVGCLNAEKAHEVIEQIDPRVVIPVNYKDPSPFLKEVGVSSPQKERVWKIQSPANLPQEQTEFKILEVV